jgi:hydrogenase nickel incorporation protein HypB
MCVTCGCGNTQEATLSTAAGTVEHEHEHEHAHGEHEHVHADGTRHTHSHGHAHQPVTQVPGRDAYLIQLEAQVLGKNQLLAERNRGWLTGRGILALNLLSSPGAGKTTLLERTLSDLKGELTATVVEGDQATSNDAERIRATGVRAVQINTGTGCHLEADMLQRALTALQPPPASLLLIENVGNLVCPALFDLGEHAKVVIFSVTEGEDKPLKYPHMFAAARLLLLSKIDLLPHVRFDAELAVANALRVNPDLSVLRLSAYSGEGLSEWYGWLRNERAACARAAA